MRKHNLTGRLTALFIDSKLTLVLILAALIFGLYAVLTTPREENPQISMPAAVVQVLRPKRWRRSSCARSKRLSIKFRASIT